jgi:hypothetical protein
MSPYDGQVAPKGSPQLVKPHHLPDQSYVPRKPKSVGEEIQCTACCDAEVIHLLALTEGEAAHATQEYFQEWGYTSALNLCLSAGYHDSKTSYMGDSHFTSVDGLECMLIKVRTARATRVCCSSHANPRRPPTALCRAGKDARRRAGQNEYQALPHQAPD